MNIFNRVKSDNTVNKNFKYSKGKVQLSFTLRTDIRGELKDFLELLKTAVAEVEGELKPTESKYFPGSASGGGAAECFNLKNK